MRRFMTILGSAAIGIAIGPVIAPALGRSLRPLARKTVKSGIRAWRRGREQATILGETFDDLHAEVLAEAGHHEMSEN